MRVFTLHKYIYICVCVYVGACLLCGVVFYKVWTVWVCALTSMCVSVGFNYLCTREDGEFLLCV